MHKVIYHKNCQDGFGAAFAAWKSLGDAGVEYIPAAYGDAPPVAAAGDQFTILDFSYPRQILLDLEKKADKIEVFDHHKSAEQDLKGLSFCTFDMNQSGALLAWRRFHPGTEIPDFMKRIDDYDRWQFKMPGTRELYAALDSYDFDFKLWDQLIHEEARLIAEGATILRHNRVTVARICNEAVPIELTDAAGIVRKGHAVNSAVLRNEIGEELLRRYPQDDFAAIFQLKGDKLDKGAWSFRSRPGGFDVTQVVSPLTIRGHASAGGGAESIKQFSEQHKHRFGA